jgi:hypothetical protein
MSGLDTLAEKGLGMSTAKATDTPPQPGPLLGLGLCEVLGPNLERDAFEAWFDAGGKWPASVERNGDGYKGAAAQSAWSAWQAGLWAARARIGQLVQAVRDANAAEAHGDYPFRALTSRQERAWIELMAGLEEPNVGNEGPP